MVGEVRLVVDLVAGPAAKYEPVGDWLWVVTCAQLFVPVLASEVQPVTEPSKF